MKTASFLATAIVLALGPTTALACTCIVKSGTTTKQRIQRLLKESDAVILAYVVKVQEHVEGHAVRQEATLRVHRSWKGPHSSGSFVETRTNVQCCMCGYALTEGVRMLLYLKGSPPYGLSTCSRNASEVDAAFDIRVLNQSTRKQFKAAGDPKDLVGVGKLEVLGLSHHQPGRCDEVPSPSPEAALHCYTPQSLGPVAMRANKARQTE